ncbi:MAG: type II toxin-antitoxin system HipA family toxin [Desulfotalea sp.]
MSKLISVCQVTLWGQNVGTAAWDNGQTFFEYDKEFLKSGLELSPIHMPLSKTIYTFPNLEKTVFHSLPGLLANSLPDSFGNNLINNWFKSQGVQLNELTPVDRLSYIGKRGMGALEFTPCLNPKLDIVVPLEVDQLLKLAKSALNNQRNLSANLGTTDQDRANAMLDIIRVGTSAGGAVPKAIIAMDKHGNIRSGQAELDKEFQHYILKFDCTNEWASEEIGQTISDTRIEFAYSLMAKAAGINMMDCELLEEAEGRTHFLTKRFDRLNGEKQHVLNFSAMAHVGWNPVGSVSYENLFAIMRALELPYAEKEEQFRRMIFNVLARNTDDHVKQFSFTMDKNGKWHITPAYDITLSYDADDFLNSQHKMTINGKQSFFVLQDFRTLADNIGINKCENIIEEVSDAVAMWPNFAQKAELNKKTTAFVQSLHLKDFTSLAPKG